MVAWICGPERVLPVDAHLGEIVERFRQLRPGAVHGGRGGLHPRTDGGVRLYALLGGEEGDHVCAVLTGGGEDLVQSAQHRGVRHAITR
jgi:hypothetical protein